MSNSTGVAAFGADEFADGVGCAASTTCSFEKSPGIASRVANRADFPAWARFVGNIYKVSVQHSAISLQRRRMQGISTTAIEFSDNDFVVFADC